MTMDLCDSPLLLTCSTCLGNSDHDDGTIFGSEERHIESSGGTSMRRRDEAGIAFRLRWAPS